MTQRPFTVWLSQFDRLVNHVLVVARVPHELCLWAHQVQVVNLLPLPLTLRPAALGLGCDVCHMCLPFGFDSESHGSKSPIREAEWSTYFFAELCVCLVKDTYA